MQHQLASDQLTVLINNLGAELQSIKSKKGTEYLWTAAPEVWPRHAPVLFPIVGKLKNNSFVFNKKEYSMGQHGFARDLQFEITKSGDTECTFELNTSPETRKFYPFEFRLSIIYQLTGNKLTCIYRVDNRALTPLLFSIGAHPGFNCPINAEELFEDHYLLFEKDQFVQTLLTDGLRAGKAPLKIQNNKLFLSASLFDHDALVFEDKQINKISLCSSVSARKILMECTGWPYFGIWSKKGNAQFVCLEPWYGIADEIQTNGQLDQKPGIIELPANKAFSCQFSMTFF